MCTLQEFFHALLFHLFNHNTFAWLDCPCCLIELIVLVVWQNWSLKNEFLFEIGNFVLDYLYKFAFLCRKNQLQSSMMRQWMDYPRILQLLMHDDFMLLVCFRKRHNIIVCLLFAPLHNGFSITPHLHYFR